MAVLSGIAAAVPRRYYPDRKEYSLLDEYVVAEGCDEREVMEQISFGEQGDFLFDDVYDTSFGDRKLVPYAPLIICCVPSTKAAFKLILRRCSRRSLPPPQPAGGTALQSPWPTAAQSSRRACSASCTRRGSCGYSCCAVKPPVNVSHLLFPPVPPHLL
jgi:hypothetical protein